MAPQSGTLIVIHMTVVRVIHMTVVRVIHM